LKNTPYINKLNNTNCKITQQTTPVANLSSLPPRSYAQATNNQILHTPPADQTNDLALTNFTNEFKALINPLLSLLTTVLDAYFPKMSNNSFTSQSLLILLWNTNGLANYKNELITTLNEKRIDLAIISETHFTSNTKFSIPGYTIIPANHPDNTAHACAAILIRSPIQFTPLPSLNEDFLQAADINIKLN